jgi:hypothetical protein
LAWFQTTFSLYPVVSPVFRVAPPREDTIFAFAVFE